jgi:hypothetical protein
MGNNPNQKPNQQQPGKERSNPRAPQQQPEREGDVKRREPGNAPKEEKSPNPRRG